MNSQYLYADALRAAMRRATAWLDLGCGHQFLPEWLPESAQRLTLNDLRAVGIDMDAAALRSHPHLVMRIVGSIEHLPLCDATFDLITANMVVEHVEQPDALFQEVSRVLKPGGLFLIHTPNVHGYTTLLTRLIPEGLRPRLANLLQGRLGHDVYRTFYRANTVASLEAAALRWHLTPVDVRTVGSSPQLYRVPVLRTFESGLLRILQADSLARWRPCIIGQFERSAGPARSLGTRS
jgi:2-polyprenyl-3-methyl-5-hydroxy-6-metoxy-1,4-benzoquinol methylase